MPTYIITQAQKDILERAVKYADPLHPSRQKALITLLDISSQAPQPRPQDGEVAPYICQNSYQMQNGGWVKFVSIHNEGTRDETMADTFGVHRYTRRDFGRVTGTAHDYSDPRNTPPLYKAATQAPQQPVIGEGEKCEHCGATRASFERYDAAVKAEAEKYAAIKQPPTEPNAEAIGWINSAIRTFERYAKHHWEKNPPDREKAIRNEVEASALRCAVKLLKGEKPDICPSHDAYVGEKL